MMSEYSFLSELILELRMMSQNLRLDINLNPFFPLHLWLHLFHGMAWISHFLSCFLGKRWGWNGWSSGSMWNSCCAALWIPRSVFLQLSDPRPLFQSLYVRYTTFSLTAFLSLNCKVLFICCLLPLSVCVFQKPLFCFLKVWFYVRCKNRLNIYTEIPSQQECFEFWESRQNGDLRLCSTKFDFVL